MMRCCMEEVAAAVGLHASSCVVLGEDHSATAVVFVVDPKNSGHQMCYGMGVLCMVKG
jgi:hypothetical protein